MMFFAATAAPEASGFSIDSIKAIMDGFDPAALLPDISTIVGKIELVCRLAVLIGPIILLIMGLVRLLIPPKEANYYVGYITWFGMGSVNAWRYTQRIAGIFSCAIGLILLIIMLLLSGSFSGMEAMDMVWRAFWCLFWQAIITLGMTLMIDFIVFCAYNGKGDLRKKKDQNR